VRNRRNVNHGFHVRLAVAGGALTLRLWTKATRRPVDTVALLAAVAASLIIIVNALFLQSGSHAAPFVAAPKPVAAATNEPRPVEPANLSHPGMLAPVQPAAARRNDPIADLIAPSPRIAAVQRALSDYGYGQMRPSGILDDSTGAAIEKFEREHKLPVTGVISDRLVNALAVMVGHPLN
jgi:hypothetical protein